MGKEPDLRIALVITAHISSVSAQSHGYISLHGKLANWFGKQLAILIPSKHKLILSTNLVCKDMLKLL